MAICYLTATTRPELFQRMRENRVYLMQTPASGTRIRTIKHFPHFGADNGCYTAGDRFDMDAYLRWLERLAPVRSRALFATAPDVVGDMETTIARSLPELERIRETGFPVALVGQDGARSDMVPWELIDAWFIGGTTAWKLSSESEALAKEAKARGKHVHMGRVNSLRRLRVAAAWGCDSADGNMLAFGPESYLDEVIGWLRSIEMQPSLL